MTAFQGDGNDIDDVYGLTGRAIAHARAGAGPAFIEFKTYRWLEHCGPLDDAPMRPAEEIADWKTRNPLAMASRALNARGIDFDEDANCAEIATEIDEAVAFAKDSPFPERSELPRHLYAESGA